MMHKLLTSFVLLCCISTFSQKEISLYFHVGKETLKQKVRLDSAGYSRAKDNAINSFKLNGYVGLTFKDSLIKGQSIHYYLDYRHRFSHIELYCENCPKPKPFSERNFTNTALALNRIITDLENKGFPFARISIKEQSEEKSKMTLHIDSGAYFHIDKIHIKSTDNIHERTFLTAINSKEGDAYNEGRIRAIEEILQNSPYYELKRPAEVLFRKGKAELFLYVAKKKSSSADGFIGFNQDPDTKKVVFNGNINLSLKNALNRAEVIDLAWKSNPDKTQNLHTMIKYPFLFGSPIGLGARINLRKQDTSFIKSDIWLEMTYSTPRFTFTLFDQIEGSATISSVTPDGFRDFKKNTIGLAVEYRPKMPKSIPFYHPQLTATGGIFNYRSDTIDDNKQKISNNKYGLGYGHTIDLLKYFHLNNKIEFQGLASSIPLANNELIYYGGLRSVRGFYELELFGNNVWIVNNEFEFRPIRSFSMALLYDYSIADYKQTKNYTNSFGIGFKLIASSYQLEIAVANGILNNNPVDFSNTRIHIGFRSNF